MSYSTADYIIYKSSDEDGIKIEYPFDWYAGNMAATNDRHILFMPPGYVPPNHAGYPVQIMVSYSSKIKTLIEYINDALSIIQRKYVVVKKDVIYVDNVPSLRLEIGYKYYGDKANEIKDAQDIIISLIKDKIYYQIRLIGDSSMKDTYMSVFEHMINSLKLGFTIPEQVDKLEQNTENDYERQKALDDLKYEEKKAKEEIERIKEDMLRNAADHFGRL